MLAHVRPPLQAGAGLAPVRHAPDVCGVLPAVGEPREVPRVNHDGRRRRVRNARHAHGQRGVRRQFGVGLEQAFDFPVHRLEALRDVCERVLELPRLPLEQCRQRPDGVLELHLDVRERAVLLFQQPQPLVGLRHGDVVYGLVGVPEGVVGYAAGVGGVGLLRGVPHGARHPECVAKPHASAMRGEPLRGRPTAKPRVLAAEQEAAGVAGAEPLTRQAEQGRPAFAVVA